MHIQAIHTPLVTANDNLEQVIAEAVPSIPERSIVIIASKLFSTTENRFVSKTTGEKAEKHELVKKEAERYLDPTSSKYGVMLTIKRNWMFANAGIDESNANDHYLLWPNNPQKSINKIWHFLRKHYGLKEVGVTMSDSISIPLNWGVTGHAIAHCGFNPLRSYIGKKDLFGRVLQMEQTNVAQAITAIASVEMGEGDEQTPLAIVSDITNVEFADHEPTAEELAALHIELEDDVFAPLLTSVTWQKGEANKG
jgi:dihydrofolate synthase / folylpolyglutamate synthase